MTFWSGATKVSLMNDAANDTLSLLLAAQAEVSEPEPTWTVLREVVDPNTVTINGKSFRVMVHSWGYDQTNIDFYAIVRETKKTIVLRRIGSETVEHAGYLSRRVVPAPNFIETKETRKRKVVGDDDKLQCSGVNDCGWTVEWTGGPETATSYH